MQLYEGFSFPVFAGKNTPQVLDGFRTDEVGRMEILKIHTKNMKLAEDVGLETSVGYYFAIGELDLGLKVELGIGAYLDCVGLVVCVPAHE